MFEADSDATNSYARKVFSLKLLRYKVLTKPGGMAARIFGIWIGSLLVLFLLTAYRPDIPRIGPGLGIDFVAEPGKMDNGLVPPFREYLGRMVGAIPPACAITEQSVPIPKPIPNSDVDPGSTFFTAFIAKGPPCEWRNHPGSILAALSPDVGSIQKITLLFLIVALMFVWRHRQFREIEMESWPERDGRSESSDDLPGYRRIGSDARMQAVHELANHPLTLVREPQKASKDFVYPPYFLHLEPVEPPTEAWEHLNRLERVGQRLEREDPGLRGPIDLMIDVFKAGAHSGRKAEAERRMRVAIYEYRDRLSGGLEMAHYLMWLLPTVGFLGTIYGISASLVRTKGLFGSTADTSQDVFQQNIEFVVDGLGVAFDTTSMALLCSAFLYWRLVKADAGVNRVADSAALSLSNILIHVMKDRDAPRDPPRRQPAPQSALQTGSDAQPVQTTTGEGG